MISFKKALETLLYSETNYINLIKETKIKGVLEKAYTDPSPSKFIALSFDLDKIVEAHQSLEKEFNKLFEAQFIKNSKLEPAAEIQELLKGIPELYSKCINNPLIPEVLATSLKKRFEDYKELLQMINESSEKNAQHMSFINKTFKLLEVTGSKIKEELRGMTAARKLDTLRDKQNEKIAPVPSPEKRRGPLRKRAMLRKRIEENIKENIDKTQRAQTAPRVKDNEKSMPKRSDTEPRTSPIMFTERNRLSNPLQETKSQKKRNKAEKRKKVRRKKLPKT